LEQALGTHIDLFSVPYGRDSATVLDLARTAGYRYALSTEFGLNEVPDQSFLLRRWNIKKSLSNASFENVLRGARPAWLRYRTRAVATKYLRQLWEVFWRNVAGL
jgi:peptidoglycan/xylan/chitin deacetylase (PgdA/CDA1 family)